MNPRSSLASALAVAVCLSSTTLAAQAAQVGSSDYVAFPHRPELVPQQGLTVEGWFTWDGSLGIDDLIRKDPTSFGESYNLKIDGGFAQWNVFDQNGIRTLLWPFTTPVPVGQPVHIAATWDGVTAALYQDGVLQGTIPTRPTMIDNGGELRIGNNFASELDEVRIWSYARSGDEIRATMRQEVDCEVGQVASFHFDGDLVDANTGISGTAVGSVNFVAETAPFDAALEVGSSFDDWVEVPDSAVLEPQNGITVEAWILWDGISFGRPTIVRKDPTPNAESYNLRIEFGRPQWQVFHTDGTGTIVWPAVMVPVNVPTHLAATWDGVECALYMNGAQIGSSPVSGPGMRDSAGALRFGRGGLSEGIDGQFAGTLDEIRIWDRARTPEEIASARITRVHDAVGLIGAWHFEHDFTSSTGTGLDGTAVGSPAFVDEFVAFDCSDSPCYETAIGTPLGMADDSLANVPLGFAFPLPDGSTTSSIDVCSNGYVWLVAGSSTDADFSPTAGEFVSGPARLAALWRDFNPADPLSDDVYVNVLPDRVIVTWHDLVQFNLTQQQTVQLQMFADGRYTVFYGPSLDSESSPFGIESLIGFHDGVSADPGSTDLSNAFPILTGSTANFYESYPMAIDVDLRNVRLDASIQGSGYAITRSCPGPEGFASFSAVGTGCPAGSPLTIAPTTAGTRPIAGSLLSVSLTGLSPALGPTALHLGFDQTDLDLTGINLTGCSLYTTPSLTVPIAPGAPFELVLSPDPSNSGLTLNFQAIGIDASANPFGAVLSNRLEATVGTY